ncbi:MAG: hypothetical protein ABEH81_11090 [Halopenitus sp.]
MRKKLGLQGIAGLLLVVVSVALLTYHDPIVGAAVMILLAGLALIAKGLISSMMGMFGM